MRSHIIGVSTVLLAVLFLAGCGAVQRTKSDPQTLLLERVEAYNQARLEQRMEEVYDFYWSEFTDVVSRSMWHSQFSLPEILSHDLKDVEFASDTEANVLVLISQDAMGYTIEGIKDEQEWVLENGQWYVKREPVFSTPFGDIPIKPQAK
jgi:hypothetical protein